MTDTTQIPEPADAPAAPTADDLAGMFQQFRNPTEPTDEPAAPEAAAAPEPEDQPEPEPAGEAETEDFDAEQEAEPAGEPVEASPAPIIPPPPGMTTAQVEAFGQLTPEMQQFVAGQEVHRTTDYQAKTTELARQRKETEALRGQYAERLQSQITALEGQTAAKPTPPDPTLRDSDPDEYERQRDDYIFAVHQRQEQEADLAKLRNEQAGELQRAQQDFVAEQQAILPTLIPESTDPARFKTIQKDVASYGTGKGYTPAQLGSFTARDFQMLYQSMLWERAKASANGTGGKPKPRAPRSQKPGTVKAPPTKAVESFDRAKKAFEAKPNTASLAGMFEANRTARGR